MTATITLTSRDHSILKLLEMTPATAAHIRKASSTFEGEPFRDERRVRERMQTLRSGGLVKTYSASLAIGGMMHYYRLSQAGYRTIHPDDQHSLNRTLLADIPPSRFAHAMATADIIVHVLVAAHASQIRIVQFHGDGQLTLAVGEHCQRPDCHFQLEQGGAYFNLLVEVDNATEPVDSLREQSIRTKILGYEAYQDWVLRSWHDHGRTGPRPAFRVVFLTKGAARVNHILWLAHECARNPDRRLCYAATQEAFLAEPFPLTTPMLNDHNGHWQPLVNLAPTSRFLREPIRLSRPLASSGVAR